MIQEIVSIDQIPADIKPDALLALCNGNPRLLEQFRNVDPDFASAIVSGMISPHFVYLVEPILPMLHR